MPFLPKEASQSLHVDVKRNWFRKRGWGLKVCLYSIVWHCVTHGSVPSMNV